MKVSIVIPVYSNFKLVNELLVNLHSYTSADEIIVADDASPDRETQAGLFWWKTNSDVSVIENKGKNLGFLRNSNFGMKVANGDIICLISTDVIVETDLCAILKRILYENPNRVVAGFTIWPMMGSRTAGESGCKAAAM